MLGYNPVSDRIITVRILKQPVNITFSQVYAPTTYTKEDEIAEFYGKVQQTVDSTPKGDVLLINGDLNAKVGKSMEPRITGKHKLGEQNTAGDQLIDFCTDNDLVIKNTCFQHYKSRLYTWVFPVANTRIRLTI